MAACEQSMRRLDQAIARLPRRLKKSLILTTLQGLSHKEAAAILRINAKAVEMRVYRARRRLAAELRREEIEEIAAISPARDFIPFGGMTANAFSMVASAE